MSASKTMRHNNQLLGNLHYKKNIFSNILRQHLWRSIFAYIFALAYNRKVHITL